MKRSMLMALWLVVAWLALWQEASFANVISGAVLATALVVVFPIGRGKPAVPFRPLAAARFAGFFVWKLLQANAIVAYQALSPHDRVVEGIVAAPLSTRSIGVATITADAVSLTPGTLTIDIDQPGAGEDSPITLYVHVLQLGDPEEVRRDVKRFEALVERAFGPARVPAGGEP